MERTVIPGCDVRPDMLFISMVILREKTKIFFHLNRRSNLIK